MSDNGEDDGTKLMVIATDGNLNDKYYFSNGVCITNHNSDFRGTYENRKATDGTTFDADQLEEFANDDRHIVWRRSDTHPDDKFWLDWGRQAKDLEGGRPEGIESVEPVPSDRHTNVTVEEGCYADPGSTITNTTLRGGSSIEGAGSVVTDSVLDNLSNVDDATVEDSHLDNTLVSEGAKVRHCRLVKAVIGDNTTVENSYLDKTVVDDEAVVRRSKLVDHLVKPGTTIEDHEDPAEELEGTAETDS